MKKMQVQDFCEKAETFVYLCCIFLIIAVSILSYADGVMRDEYHLALDGIRLSQNLLLLIVFTGLLLFLRRTAGSKIFMVILMVVFIPVFCYSFTTVGVNISMIKTIVEGAIQH